MGSTGVRISVWECQAGEPEWAVGHRDKSAGGKSELQHLGLLREWASRAWVRAPREWAWTGKRRGLETSLGAQSLQVRTEGSSSRDGGAASQEEGDQKSGVGRPGGEGAIGGAKGRPQVT